MNAGKKSTKKQKNNEELDIGFFEALAMLEKERGLPADYLSEKIRGAIATAVKKDYGVEDENVSVVIDPVARVFSVSLLKTIVEEVYDPAIEVDLKEAREKDPSYQLDDTFAVPLNTRDFGRIAAQTAKHMIRQGLKEAERSQMFAEMQSRSHEIISGVITNIDPERGAVTLDLGRGSIATLPRSEQMPGEQLKEGQHLRVYVVDVVEGDRAPRMMLSRTHPGLVKRMFEMEVPEIFDGTVEVKAISREAGARTKMAVWSQDPNVDAVGACIGPKGQRVAKIVEELGGEKIDVVRWSEDPSQFISAALSPANVLRVELLEDGIRSCRVTVPDNQLSLAIGNKGQNARLTARLTGYNIDIRPESGYFGEDEPKKAPAKPEGETLPDGETLPEPEQAEETQPELEQAPETAEAEDAQPDQEPDAEA